MQDIIVPYICRIRDSLSAPSQTALIIMDVFKPHTSPVIKELLLSNNLQCVLIPANHTDQFQPLDISVNKPAKAKMRQLYSDWFSDEIVSQLQQGITADKVNVDVKLSKIKSLHAKWIIDVYNHLRSSQEHIANGFRSSGILDAANDPGSILATEDPFYDV